MIHFLDYLVIFYLREIEFCCVHLSRIVRSEQFFSNSLRTKTELFSEQLQFNSIEIKRFLWNSF